MCLKQKRHESTLYITDQPCRPCNGLAWNKKKNESTLYITDQPCRSRNGIYLKQEKERVKPLHHRPAVPVPQRDVSEKIKGTSQPSTSQTSRAAPATGWPETRKRTSQPSTSQTSRASSATGYAWNKKRNESTLYITDQPVYHRAEITTVRVLIWVT